MADFSIKQNDTLPAIICAPKTEDGSALDLTGVTGVKFLMRNAANKTVKVNRAGAVSTGNLRYAWQAADTDTAGLYEAEFECTTSAGIFTVPTEGYISVEVIDDIG